jgi:ring-1,2-phenylacetyl-CoA epoxidase subunit PaaA
VPDRFTGEVRSAAALDDMPPDYRAAVSKIVVSHAINELVGAQVFDEPAIALAPTPYDKWLACRIAMEEYGHHVRFSRLAADMGVDRALLENPDRRLSIFDYQARTWADFIIIKSIVDLAEIIQMEDLNESTYAPLRELSRKLMPEERFHAGFGRDRLKELVQTGDGKAALQEALDRIFPVTLPFFGQSQSKNNALYRQWGIKRRTNEEMRADWVDRVRNLCDEFGLRMPPIPDHYPELAFADAAPRE